MREQPARGLHSIIAHDVPDNPNDGRRRALREEGNRDVRRKTDQLWEERRRRHLAALPDVFFAQRPPPQPHAPPQTRRTRGGGGGGGADECGAPKITGAAWRGGGGGGGGRGVNGDVGGGSTVQPLCAPKPRAPRRTPVDPFVAPDVFRASGQRYLHYKTRAAQVPTISLLDDFTTDVFSSFSADGTFHPRPLVSLVASSKRPRLRAPPPGCPVAAAANAPPLQDKVFFTSCPPPRLMNSSAGSALVAL